MLIRATNTAKVFLLLFMLSVWGIARADVQIGSIVPSQGAPGETVNITINGQEFSAATTFLFDDLDAYVSNLTFVNSTKVTLTIAIPDWIPVGQRDFLARNSDSMSIAAFIVDNKTVSGLPVKLIATGSLIAEAAYVTEDNQIHVWGFRGSGQAGNGVTVSDTTLVNRFPRASRVGDNLEYPYNMRDENGNRLEIRKLHTNAHTLFALTEDGDLWAWGQNHHGSAGCDRIAAELNPAKGWSAVP